MSVFNGIARKVRAPPKFDYCARVRVARPVALALPQVGLVNKRFITVQETVDRVFRPRLPGCSDPLGVKLR